MSSLVAPHGGRLVDRVVSQREAPAFREQAEKLPSLTVDARALLDLELLATGAASPLTGFLGSADYDGVVDRLRLADGTPWPVPLTLAVSREQLARVTPGAEVALRDASGRLWGTLSVTETYEGDPRREALAVYGTVDEAHPGVAYLLGRPKTLVAGPVRVLPLPMDLPLGAPRLTPAQLRARISERGWRRVAGYGLRGPLHHGHEHLSALALEQADGLVLHAAVSETLRDQVPVAARFLAYETALERCAPRERPLLAALPVDGRFDGPRGAVLSALVGKNYGISHPIGGESSLLAAFAPGELGVEPLGVDTADGRGVVAAPKGQGYVVWFTGLSGAGKSTLSQALKALLGTERPVEILDGDEVRTHLSKGLGFSREDRDTNVRRIGYVARLLARNGAVAVTAAISPYQETRDEVRALAERDGVEFVEVFADASIEVLSGRDVKGLYKKALAGEIAHFTGVSDPYERPTKPDVVVHSDHESIDQSLSRIVAHLRARGLLDGRARRSPLHRPSAAPALSIQP